MSDPMTDPGAAGPKRPTLVKCEKHGLHYDSATMTGCVICRREAGGGAAARNAAPASSGSLGLALAVTAVLLVLTTAALYFIHGMAIETFQAWTSGGPSEARTLDQGFERQMEEMGLPADDPGPADGAEAGDGEDD